MVDLDRLERVLIQAARERRALTYGQVLAYFERRVTRITVGALCKDLGRVERRRKDEGWPDLACLVVRKADGLPGEGYFASLRQEEGIACASTGPQAQALIAARQARAFAWAAGIGDAADRAPEARPGTGQTAARWPADSRAM